MGSSYYRRKIFLLIFSVLITLSIAIILTPQAWAVTYLVTYQNNIFTPSSVNIVSGDTVIWQNLNSGGILELASDPHPLHTNYPPLNLGMVLTGGSAQLVFNQTGNYSFHNHLLPSATGSVAVYPVSGFTLADLRQLLFNYLGSDDHLYNDDLYNPADQKINALDAAFLIYQL